MDQWILKMFGTNVLLGKIMCHDQDPNLYLKGQCHNLGSQVKKRGQFDVSPTSLSRIGNKLVKIIPTFRQQVAIQTQTHIPMLKVTNWGQRSNKKGNNLLFRHSWMNFEIM